jgi:starch-binding outer membrane protein, SusD/RagB family
MNHKLWVAPLALTFALGACDNMLQEEPRAFITTSTFYKTDADLEKGMLSGWGSLRSVFTGSYNGWSGFMGYLSDQERTDPNEVNSPRNVGGLDFTASNMQGLDVGWQNLYRLIYRENIIIARAGTATGDKAKIDQIVGEAKFLRGYAYMWLDRMHSAGTKPTDASVPLILTEEEHTNQKVARATSAEVQAAALKDLQDAEAVLPTRTQRGTNGRGRPTKGSAQMAIADLYLWRASFMGLPEWNKVDEWTKKVIDSGQYSLVNTGFFNIFNPGVKAANNEYIFFMVATGAAGRQNSAYINAYGPRQLGFGNGGGFGVNQVTEWQLKLYADGDIRGRIGPVPVVGTRQSDTVAYRNYGCSTGKVAGFTDDGGRCGPVTTMPYKFRATDLIAGNGDVDVSHYRYAETLLMAAEAKAHLGDNTNAIALVNQVRARARRGATGTDNRAEPKNLTDQLSGHALIDEILLERSRELAHEGGKRWIDIVRHDSEHQGYWTEALRHDPQSMSIAPNTPEQLFKKRLPVPQREIDLNDALTQNPGY